MKIVSPIVATRIAIGIDANGLATVPRPVTSAVKQNCPLPTESGAHGSTLVIFGLCRVTSACRSILAGGSAENAAASSNPNASPQPAPRFNHKEQIMLTARRAHVHSATRKPRGQSEFPFPTTLTEFTIDRLLYTAEQSAMPSDLSPQEAGALLAVPIMSILVTVFKAARARAMQLDAEVAAQDERAAAAPRPSSSETPGRRKRLAGEHSDP